ncbi:RodZ family helix-turn-helix domain-containing protein [Anabaena sp. PCC 7108]|uniref:helix-turn-helix domain-containing protein n=1 Tax=Anabaena sp. PCC 7108 TaxID=163908 RepID=UPI000346327D|nr:helix-turn-helix domain-containing protein [Anabaena sp. PCC 7108]
MTMASAYLFKIPGNPTIQISQDELRSLLTNIEAELHRSQVYNRAVANLQKLLGSSNEQARLLFKAVGREAITLAFKQFARQHKLDANINSPTNNTESQNVDLEQSSNLPQSSESIKLDSKLELVNTSQENLPSQPQSHVLENTEQESHRPKHNPIKWSWPHQKLGKIKLADQIAAEKRLESLRQIGEQLKQARESQGLTLQKLHIYTHISIHQMEAVENANFDLLPEDVLIRGFIRVMGNALGINGIILAASLPMSNQAKSVLPSWYHVKKSVSILDLEIRPVHLYMGYTALVAGAIGGLSFMTQQSQNNSVLNSEIIIPTTSSLCQSTQKTQANIKPGINSSSTGVCVGSDISPPEAF